MTASRAAGGLRQSRGLRSSMATLKDASRIFGATRLRTLVDMTAPLIRNGVIATWILIFIGSIRELSATIVAAISFFTDRRQI